jgi:hypothetical protein
MNKQMNGYEKPPQEIPDKKNPSNPQPERDPDVKNNTNPSKHNPVNPKTDA